MTVTSAALTAAILAVREELLASGQYPTLAHINRGYCDGFCSDVADHLGIPAGAEEPFELGIDNLMESDGDEPTIMDRALLEAHWPDIQPPEGLDWDDVDRLAADAGFSSGTHVWLCLDKRHYDAEAPEGVGNPFDLPFFKRVVASWLEECPAPAP